LLLRRDGGLFLAMKITDALFAEHLVFHSLFDYLEQKAPRLKTLAEIKSVAAMLEAMLHAHSHTEDTLFIEPLEHCFEQIGQRETFHAEHDEIEGNLKLIQKRFVSRRPSTSCWRRWPLRASILTRKSASFFPWPNGSSGQNPRGPSARPGWNSGHEGRPQCGSMWAYLAFVEVPRVGTA